MTQEELENKIRILEQKLELKELEEKKKTDKSNLFSRDNATLLIAIFGGIISILTIYLQKAWEVQLEGKKFEDVLYQKAIDAAPEDQKQAQRLILFYNTLGLIKDNSF